MKIDKHQKNLFFVISIIIILTTLLKCDLFSQNDVTRKHYIVDSTDVFNSLKNTDTLNFSNSTFIRNKSKNHFEMGDILSYKSLNSDNWNFYPSLTLYKTSMDWWSSFALRTYIDDTTFKTGGNNTHILGSISETILKISSGTQANPIYSNQGTVKLNLTGSATITDTWRNGGVQALTGIVTFKPSSSGTISNVNGCRIWIYPEGAHTTAVTNVFGFQSVIEKSSTASYTNAYGYYSQFPNTMTGNTYHFYGSGNYPSYFGGDIILNTSSTPASATATGVKGRLFYPFAAADEKVRVAPGVRISMINTTSKKKTPYHSVPRSTQTTHTQDITDC